MKKKQDLSPVQFLLVLLGVFAWSIAGYFASWEPTKTVEPRSNAGTAGVAIAPNNVAAAGVLGFSLAGGLCFLGCGVGGWKGKEDGPPASPPDR